MILGGVLVGAVMLVPLLTGNRTLGGADIKCSAACAFLLGLKRGLIGLTAGLLLAVIINGIKNRKSQVIPRIMGVNQKIGNVMQSAMQKA